MSRLTSGVSSWQTVLSVLVLCGCTQAISVEGQLQNAQGNTTILRETRISGWVDNTTFRGTSDILWSCLVTIFASAWTAMHPNIPVHTKSEIQRLYHRLGLTAKALLTPELVVKYAFNQYQSARRLKEMLCKLNNDSDDAKIYNTTFGFYVDMGGFVADVRDFSDAHPRVIITTKGVQLLAEYGYIDKFQVLPEQIRDRSKSDTIAKFLVCCQILWMFLQCIVRYAAGYTLTLLEIHTMVSVICTLIIYTLWWHKPMSIHETIPIKMEGIEDIIAIMLVAEMYRWRRKKFPTIDDISTKLVLAVDTQSTLPDLTSHIDGSNNEKLPQTSELHKIHPEDTEQSTAPTEHPPSNRILLTDGSYIICERESIDTTAITSKDIKRWDLVVKALRRPVLPLNGSHIALAEIRQTFSRCVEIFLSTEDKKNGFGGSKHHVELGSNQGIDRSNKHWYSKVPPALLSMVYGGLHLVAWNYEFPSKIESYWWKISGLAIVILPPLNIVVNSMLYWAGWLIGRFARQYPKVDMIGRSLMDKAPYSHGLLTLIIFTLLAASICFWMLCRTYLLVESFISLRYVALGCFADTPWLQAIPHI